VLVFAAVEEEGLFVVAAPGDVAFVAAEVVGYSLNHKMPGCDLKN